MLADGPATDQGEMALGKNILIGFMTWEGYNYEDAVLLNERLVRDDVYTSIHIEEYELDSRDTKLGPEEITRDIPNVGEDALRTSTSAASSVSAPRCTPAISWSARSRPKGETELTAEERLLRDLRREGARGARYLPQVRRTARRHRGGRQGVHPRERRRPGPACQHGRSRLHRTEAARSLSAIRWQAATATRASFPASCRRRICRSCRTARPLDIVLNPLGVPSRMNIGQVLEVHLGFAAKKLGWKVETPVFDGATLEDINARPLVAAGVDEDGKSVLYDGRTGDKFRQPRNRRLHVLPQAAPSGRR